MTLRTGTWLAEPHHDGSARYVSHLSPKLGDTVTVLLRVPHATQVAAVHVRVVPDGEHAFVAARTVRTTDTDDWWSADLVCHNPVTNYRFLLAGGPTEFAWYNGTGLHHRDVPDAADFRLVASEFPAPEWARGAVVYQIFPDRFARSPAADRRELPEWAVPAAWDDPVDLRRGIIGTQLYGGDLDGIVAHLDHIAALGVDVIYLTPFFPSRSNHRYDASSFDAVDPLLGGDPALRRLTKAAHERGLRVMGDFTTNHTGDGHEWFVRASGPGGRRTTERDYYLWDGDRYVSWLGVPSLPKLNHRNEALRHELFENPRGVVRRWLGRSGGLDGWRVDVANMTGRYKDTDLNHAVARQMRNSMGRNAPEALLVAEHVHDYTVDLPGDGWHGVMNYAGFCKPVWTWLRAKSEEPNFMGAPVPVPRHEAHHVVDTMRDFTARIPWTVLVHSFNLVGSHDSTRVRTLVGHDPADVDAAAGLLFTMPSMPMLTYGDEIGMEGTFGEDGRRPMPWDESRWDTRILGVYRDLIAARRSSVALREGGLRWLHADGDAIVFLRESLEEVVLVHVSRGPHETLTVPLTQLGGIESGTSLYGKAPRFSTSGVSLDAKGTTVRIWSWTPTDGGPVPARSRRAARSGPAGRSARPRKAPL